MDNTGQMIHGGQAGDVSDTDISKYTTQVDHGGQVGDVSD